jgi:opacity protein-like surface antigen
VQALKYLLLLFMLVLNHFAFANVPVFGSSAESKYARELTPPKGKAIVYIYQRKQDGAGVSPIIKLNKYEIGRIVPGSFTVWQLAPGRLELHVGGVEPVSLSLTSQAGKVYLFRLSVTQTVAGPKAQLESLPATYRTDLAATQYIKNPRQVTPAVVQIPAKPVTPPTTPPAAAAKPVAEPQPEPEMAWQAGGVALLLKIGTLSLSKDTQTILGVDRSFDKSASGIYAIEAYYQLDDGLAVGGELLGYKSQFTTPSNTDTGDVTAHVLLANAKQYYRTDTRVQPFIGAGIGIATTSVSGSISGNTSGFAYQLMAGLEYRASNVGVFGEAKYVGANTKTSNGQKVDATGIGFFAGVAFHF